MATPEMKIVQPGETAEPAGEQQEQKQPTMEEIRAEFMKTLETPIGPDEHKQAQIQVLLCDIQIAELEQAIAGLEAQIAANKAEIAKHKFAQAIIQRRLANKAK